MTNNILFEDNINHMNMPENLSIGMMVAKQHQKCSTIGCDFDYYGFAFGQSPFPVPNPLKEALQENVENGNYSDAGGILELREAVAGFNSRYFGSRIDPDRIIIGPGTKTLLFMIFSIIQGTVIIPTPSWIGYTPLIRFLGKKQLDFPLRPENGYKINPQELDAFLARLSTRTILVINNPHNPTGKVYTRQELTEIATVCRKHGTIILADEIYALTTYQFENFTSMGIVYPEGTFITNGLSKDRSAGGYRLGTCILPEQKDTKLREAFIKLAASLYSNVSTPIQLAATTVYNKNQEIEDYFRITRVIHRIIGRAISNKCNDIEGLSATVPDGGFYFLLDFNKLSNKLKKKGIANSNELGHALLAHPHHIATITGDSILVQPNNYAARIAFVDYDGTKAYDHYKNSPPKTIEDEQKFVDKHASHMLSGIESLEKFITME